MSHKWWVSMTQPHPTFHKLASRGRETKDKFYRSSNAFKEIPLRTGAEISGARFHRAEHVENVLHGQTATVIDAPVLIKKLTAQAPRGA